MPLTLNIPARELFDEKTSQFIYTPRTTLTLEHSLLSVSRWESKWKKPYLRQIVLTDEANKKTRQEELDYISCMSVNGAIDKNVLKALTPQEKKQITDYINEQRTATTITKQKNGPPNREIITSELIYYWMTALQIPFRPCETWHLSRLLSLIEIAALKQDGQKGKNPADAMKTRASINAARRAAHSKSRPHK